MVILYLELYYVNLAINFFMVEYSKFFKMAFAKIIFSNLELRNSKLLLGAIFCYPI